MLRYLSSIAITYNYLSMYFCLFFSFVKLPYFELSPLSSVKIQTHILPLQRCISRYTTNKILVHIPVLFFYVFVFPIKYLCLFKNIDNYVPKNVPAYEFLVNFVNRSLNITIFMNSYRENQALLNIIICLH